MCLLENALSVNRLHSTHSSILSLFVKSTQPKRRQWFWKRVTSDCVTFQRNCFCVLHSNDTHSYENLEKSWNRERKFFFSLRERVTSSLERFFQHEKKTFHCFCSRERASEKNEFFHKRNLVMFSS
jgi:hypothetical protein